MEITKMSTKGQIVIPEKLRRNVEVGTPFIVSKNNDLIILKKLKGLTKKEIEEISELDKIWKDIDSGKGITLDKEEFLKETNTW